MKRSKYLKFYKKCMKTGKIPYREARNTAGGLCSCFPNDKKLSLFQPSDGESWWYWGYSGELSCSYDIETAFTPMRQTIVLFLAAMNNEL